MSVLHEARTVSVSIRRPAEAVYEYVHDVANLPEWSFFTSATPSGEEWIVGTPGGESRLRLAERNDLGVLDHWVTTANGRRIHIPMRVVANGDGSEVTFTVFRMPGMSDGAYAADVAQVEEDLGRLRTILESESPLLA